MPLLQLFCFNLVNFVIVISGGYWFSFGWGSPDQSVLFLNFAVMVTPAGCIYGTSFLLLCTIFSRSQESCSLMSTICISVYSLFGVELWDQIILKSFAVFRAILQLPWVSPFVEVKDSDIEIALDKVSIIFHGYGRLCRSRVRAWIMCSEAHIFDYRGYVCGL